MFQREDLVPDRLYQDTRTGLFFVSPDGVGVYWYDSRAEAIEDYCFVDLGSTTYVVTTPTYF